MAKVDHWAVKYRNQVADTKGISREVAKENIKNSKKLSGFKSVLDSKIKKNPEDSEDRSASDSNSNSSTSTASSTAAGAGGTLSSRLGMGGGVSNPQGAQAQSTEQKFEGLKQSEIKIGSTAQNLRGDSIDDRREKTDEQS